MLGPVLTSSGIMLHPPDETSAPQFVEWFANPAVTRFLPVRNPMSLADELSWLRAMSSSQNDVIWAISFEQKLVGMTGLHLIDWRNRHCHNGIVLGERESWGRGIATEAIRMTTNYAFSELNLQKVKTGVITENTASLRMVKRLGFAEVGIHRREWFREGVWWNRWVGEVFCEDWKDN